MNPLENMLAKAGELGYTVTITEPGNRWGFSHQQRRERRIHVNEDPGKINFVLAHELGHALEWETGSMNELISEQVAEEFAFKRALPQQDLWGVPLPHIPKSERRAYRKRQSKNNFESLQKFVQGLKERYTLRSERRAWELGEQFIPENERPAYWALAKVCLQTYGAEEG